MFEENIPLKEYTTMKTGGSTRYFFTARSDKDVSVGVSFAKEKNIPIFILGGGSNVVVSDDGFRGVVIKMEIPGVVFEEINKGEVRVISGAGVLWDDLVGRVVDESLYGLENLSLIPGTVGAAPVQNIGAYGTQVCDAIAWVEVMDMDTMEIKRIENKECLLGYRCSLFKSAGGEKFIILRVAFDLKKNGELNMDYADIQKYFNENEKEPTLHGLRAAIVEIRTDKLPDLDKEGTAGSFFENPIVSDEKIKELLVEYPGIKYFPAGGNVGGVKLSAAWLLDKIGNWKGVCVGDACVHDKQALVLINKGKSTTKDILSLAKKMRNDVKQKTGVTLELEVNLV